MSSVSSYYTQNATTGQPGNMHYSNWNGQNTNINPLLENDPVSTKPLSASNPGSGPNDLPPIAEQFQNQAARQQYAQQQFAQQQYQQQERARMQATQLADASSNMTIPLTAYAAASDDHDPNATPLSMNHFRPASREFMSNDSDSASSSNSDEPIYHKAWFWVAVAGGALVLLLILLWWWKSHASNGGMSTASGGGDGGVGSGGFSNAGVDLGGLSNANPGTSSFGSGANSNLLQDLEWL